MRTLHRSIDGGPALDPAEGRPDLDLPGADHGQPGDPGAVPGGDPADGAPDLREGPASPEAERRDELADRVGSGTPSPAGRDRPDLLPDVEPPEAQA